MELRREFDPSILLLAVGLTCFGVVMVYSSSSIMAAKRFDDGFFFLRRQGLYAMLGFVLMAVFSQIDYKRLRPLAVPALLGCGLLLVAVLIPGIGVAAGGATRWLSLGGVSVQPGELAKLALVLYMAHSLAKKKDRITDFNFGFLPYMIVLALLLGLLLMQPDLGTAVSLAVIALVILMIAGTRWTYLSSVAVLSVPFLYFAVMNVEYRRKRLLAFIDPWQDPSDTGFQIIQSWLAFGAGGWLGKGLGEGKQKLFYLPEAHTDFIFSVVGEELGFVGVLTVTIMFFVLVWRGLKVSLEAPDDFGCYLAFGLSLLLGFGAVVNLGVALGLLPTKGMTLPFISYGGTSLVTTLAGVGILLNISAQTQGGGR